MTWTGHLFVSTAALLLVLVAVFWLLLRPQLFGGRTYY
jgi:cbb3-type cytochrome oxidase subunit 3